MRRPWGLNPRGALSSRRCDPLPLAVDPRRPWRAVGQGVGGRRASSWPGRLTSKTGDRRHVGGTSRSPPLQPLDLASPAPATPPRYQPASPPYCRSVAHTLACSSVRTVVGRSALGKAMSGLCLEFSMILGIYRIDSITSTSKGNSHMSTESCLMITTTIFCTKRVACVSFCHRTAIFAQDVHLMEYSEY
ncbi:hypothetical protein BS78_09G044100 [Paspalum vaginatum]|nr:hypothetical protein BS78_09G044100 [Paspalum vaginatum]